MTKNDEIRDLLPKLGQNIVIVGPPRSGKTTLAHGLFNQLLRDGKAVMLKAIVESEDRWNYPKIGRAAEITIWDREPPPEVARHPFTRWISIPPIIE